MKTFLVVQNSTYSDTFKVVAESEDAAKELVLDGGLEPIETVYLTSDLDSNNLEVTEIK